MKLRLTIISIAALAGAWSSPALADPCEGALPAGGTTFTGAVRYVGDGDGLCIGPAGRPNRWIEVRLADFYAAELHEPGGIGVKNRLERLAMGKMLVCRAGRRSYERIVATCTLGGRALGNLLRSAGGTEGGAGRPRLLPADMMPRSAEPSVRAFDMRGAQEAEPTDKNLRGLRTPVRVAQEMGTRLGSGKILLGSVSSKGSSGLTGQTSPD